MQLLKNSVGRKLVMSVSGLAMIVFVIAHLLGNASIYAGPDGINAYAKALRSFGPLAWSVRITMIFMFVLHICYGTKLTIENRAAKPDAYAVRNNLETTFAGRNMIWTGLLIALFLIYHLLHFTFQVIPPKFPAVAYFDWRGRPDVFMMVVSGLSNLFVSMLYISALAALGLHLAHSIQSSLQTIGVSNERTLPAIMKAGTLAAIIIFLGYAAIPLAILSGILR